LLSALEQLDTALGEEPLVDGASVARRFSDANMKKIVGTKKKHTTTKTRNWFFSYHFVLNRSTAVCGGGRSCLANLTAVLSRTRTRILTFIKDLEVAYCSRAVVGRVQVKLCCVSNCFFFF
jgi:hypothetical protein